MKPSSHAAASQRASQSPAHDPPRRNFLTEFLAIVIGGLVGLFPFAAGLLVFLDPVLKKKSAEGSGPEDGKPYLRVASLSMVPADGTPIQVPVISDLEDAWNREVNQPIGAVYLIRKGDDVFAYNAICPHAGCFVGFAADRGCFQCPCHTSSFQTDGSRILPSPSPRDMDPLLVDPEKLKQNQEVWVQFVNYYPGKEEREAK